ncbi:MULTISPECIES: hypothetical protein [Pseudomonas]|uniref:Uncharacterized protein n=1 Tax=Pseudomonas wuhanensis TaxID=2954098 RepID=A0ABY9GVE9_9PSED|nr:MULTISPECIES: hypothetical protein [unclassified Pseudomonas]WLI13887.1 hypothetical protein PSH65_07035 [Pseudomonas sp. FP603]WLI19785.1 hypothetical protein PSH88_07040 [Pseudomonas sp. FP607]
MQIETVSVTAEWSIAGTSVSYQDSKSFSLNIDADEPAELIEERARGRARQLIASGGNWSPGVVRINELRVTRHRPTGL